MIFTFPVTLWGGLADLVFLQAETAISAATTTYTFTNANIGVAAADRYVLAVIGCATTTAGRTLNSVTIGGAAATLHVNAQSSVPASSTSISAIAGLLVTSGTTATIEAIFSGNMSTCHCAVYVLRKWLSTTPTATQATTSTSIVSSLNDSINVPSNGALLVGSKEHTSTGNISFTGVNLDYTNSDGNSPAGSGHIDGLAAESPRAYSTAISSSSGAFSMAAAVWH